MSGFRKDLLDAVSRYPLVENGEASDVIVRSQDEVYVVIAEKDLNKVNKKKAGTTTMLARGIGGRALIVAEKMGNEDLMDEVVYERYGLPAVNLDTFIELLEGKRVYIRKKKSMYVVSINSKRLKELREENNISLGALADYLGVSRKSVYEYERGRNKVSVDVAVKLAELFGDEILEPVELEEFEGIEIEVAPHTELEAEMLEKTDSVHVPKGKVSVGGSLEDKEFTALVPHGKEDELEWFAKLSNLIPRVSVAVGFDSVPKELEDSKVTIVPNLEGFLQFMKTGEKSC